LEIIISLADYILTWLFPILDIAPEKNIDRQIGPAYDFQSISTKTLHDFVRFDTHQEFPFCDNSLKKIKIETLGSLHTNKTAGALLT
jgi:hypothetical protein